MIRLAAVLLLCLPALASCVSAGTSVGYTTFRVEPERGPSRCENYAGQTYYNVYEDLYAPGEGFGTRGYARRAAERAADRAFERCLSGRLN